MRENLDRIAPFLPWLGLVLLVAGFITLIITRSFDLVTNILLVAGVIALLLYVIFRPDDIRRLAAGRQVKYGTITILSIVFFAVIAVLLYWIAFENDDWRLDLTAANEFTPLDETIELLETYDEPIDVIGFYSTSSFDRRNTAEERLQSLKAYKPNLSYEFIDPNADPIVAQRYEVSADSTLVFVRNRDQENEVTSQAATTTDRDIHTALVQLINPRMKTAYFLTGHGELDSAGFGQDGASEIVGNLEDQGFTIQQLNLALEGVVPLDADVVVVAGPQAPMQPAEVAALGEYLSNGGTAFIARDVIIDENGLNAEEDDLRAMLLDEWGIRLRSDLILDYERQVANQSVPVDFIANTFGTSPIISADFQSLGIYLEIARSVGYQETAGISYIELVKTSEESWGETNFNAPAALDEADAPGPVNVAISAENTATGGRLVVVGDVNMLTNNGSRFNANSLFFTNAMNWLAGDEAALELTPRETINRSINLQQSDLALVQVLSCLIGPSLVGLIGLVVWYTRRRTQ
jgi:ABC-type uncharacterized transport system involved in gliding motility auxiliary subunit